MPVNEASRPRTQLTKRQRHEATAALYGVPAELTEFDVDTLRALLRGDEDPPEFLDQ